MSELERRQVLRDNYLVALYELSDGGNPLQWGTHQQIAEVAGIPVDDVMTIGQVVSGQRLAEFKTMGGLGGHVSITPSGVRRAEEIIRDRERTGEALYLSVLVLSDTDLLRALEPLVARIRVALDSTTGIDPDVRSDIASDVGSAEAQLRANEPNRGVIRESLRRIKMLWPAISGAASIAADIIAIVHGL